MSASGTVPGRQTVGRAELCAALWAYQCNPNAHLVIDNQYVANGIQAIIQRRAHKLLDGIDADLWLELQTANRRP